MSDAGLLREFARRRLAKGFDLEGLAEDAQRDMGEETSAVAIAALPAEDGTPSPYQTSISENLVRRVVRPGGLAL